MKKIIYSCILLISIFITGCNKEINHIPDIPNDAIEILDDVYVDSDDKNNVKVYCFSEKTTIPEYLYLVMWLADCLDGEKAVIVSVPEKDYILDIDVNGIDELNLPDKWKEYIKENEIGTSKTIQEFVSKAKGDEIEANVDGYIKYYLNK